MPVMKNIRAYKPMSTFQHVGMGKMFHKLGQNLLEAHTLPFYQAAIRKNAFVDYEEKWAQWIRSRIKACSKIQLYCWSGRPQNHWLLCRKIKLLVVPRLVGYLMWYLGFASTLSYAQCIFIITGWMVVIYVHVGVKRAHNIAPKFSAYIFSVRAHSAFVFIY